MAHQTAVLDAKIPHGHEHGHEHECACGHEHGHRHEHGHAHHHHGHAHGQALLPLSLAQCGQPMTIMAIRGRDDTKAFLCNLGFVEGGAVTAVCSNGGDLIVDVKGTRVAVGRQMAARIMVG